MQAQLKELECFRAEFLNEAGNPLDKEVVYLDAYDRVDAMEQVEEYRVTHPFKVVLLSLEQLDSAFPVK